MKQIFVVILLFSALLLGGCGVLSMLSQNDESIREEILQHLYQKYGVEFTTVSLERGHHDFLTAFRTGGDPIDDFVGVQRHTRDGNVEFRDTFFGRLIREEIEASVAGSLSNMALPVQVFFSSYSVFFDNRFDGTKNFADFNQWVAEGNHMRLMVSVFFSVDSAENADEYAQQAFEKVQETGYVLGVHLNFIPHTAFEQLTRDNVTQIFAQYRSQSVGATRLLN